jgi:acetyltransferase-like isoleucine patch superfamily enzyme
MNLESSNAQKLSANATISEKALISRGVQIWNYSQVRENAFIGENTVIGSHVYIDANVKIGKNCKVQSGALIYDAAEIFDYVFIGPGVILTNDRNPRAVKNNYKMKTSEDWFKVGVRVLEGASIGAASVCVAPLVIGKWSLIGAGSVLIKDVPDFALIVGNPGRQIGWVGPGGVKLEKMSDFVYQCPETKVRFILSDGRLSEEKK